MRGLILSSILIASSVLAAQPQSPAPAVVISTKTCTVTVSDASPAAGYAVQFKRLNKDGSSTNIGSKDATPPFERNATVNAGTYRFIAVWTKSGAPTITSAALSSGCPEPPPVVTPTPIPTPTPTVVPTPTPTVTPTPTPTPTVTPTPAVGLVTAQDLTYFGSFRLSNGGTDLTTFAYGGGAFAFNPAKGTLFGVGHAWYQRVAEITIPAIRQSTTLGGLAQATFVQPFTDILAGKLELIGPNSKMVGGLLPTAADLIATGFLYYDGIGQQTESHFRTSLNFSTIAPENVTGPLQVGNTQAGWVSGYMAPIPPEWQAALGGDTLTGQCCIPIISRTSFGPSVSVITAADIGTRAPVPATRVLGYPQANPTLGDWASSGQLFNGTTAIGGVVFPGGTRSLLFFGRRGKGPFCYGEGTSAQPVGVDAYGNPRCYDPTNASKGNHAYPYESFVWAYDVLDLIAVKQGTKQMYQVQPYATWPIALPFSAEVGGVGEHLITGVAYDAATRRIFLAAGYADGPQPLMHVLQVK